VSEHEATPCPACRGRLYPKLLACADCGLEVSTRYRGNEFAALADEHLHLLRVFVLCEGRIRDMEAVLGVSYPTVKARIAALRAALGLKAAADERPATGSAETAAGSVSEIIDRLTDGSLSYEAAMARIRALRARS
jgi:hypothetical protein